VSTPGPSRGGGGGERGGDGGSTSALRPHSVGRVSRAVKRTGTNICRVYLPNHDFVSGTIEADSIAGELSQMVMDKFGLLDGTNFGLFEVDRAEHTERWIDPRAHPFKIIALWGEENNKQTFGQDVHRGGGGGGGGGDVAAGRYFSGGDEGLDSDSTDDAHKDTFHPLSPESLYRRPPKKKDTSARFKFLFRAHARTRAPVTDEAALDLLFTQAAGEVSLGKYAGFVLAPDAVKLAGLQLHVTLGDYNGAVHHPGFLGDDRVAGLLPRDMVAERSIEDWEYAILKEHAACVGITADQARRMYLELLYEVPTYGSSWYESDQHLGKGETRPVIVAVNMNGLHVLDASTWRVELHVSSERVIAWSRKRDLLSIEYDAGSVGGEVARRLLRFQCPLAKEMGSLLDIYQTMSDEDMYGTGRRPASYGTSLSGGGGGGGSNSLRFDTDRRHRARLAYRATPGDRNLHVTDVSHVHSGDTLLIDRGAAGEETAVCTRVEPDGHNAGGRSHGGGGGARGAAGRIGGTVWIERGCAFPHEEGTVIEPPARAVPLDVDAGGVADSDADSMMGATADGVAGHPLAVTRMTRRLREHEAKEDLGHGLFSQYGGARARLEAERGSESALARSARSLSSPGSRSRSLGPAGSARSSRSRSRSRSQSRSRSTRPRRMIGPDGEIVYSDEDDDYDYNDDVGDGGSSRGGVPGRALESLRLAPMPSSRRSSNPPPLSMMASFGDNADNARPRTINSWLPPDWVNPNTGTIDTGGGGATGARRDDRVEELKDELLKRDAENARLKREVSQSRLLLRKLDVHVKDGDDPIVEHMEQLRLQEKRLREGNQEVQKLREELEWNRRRLNIERENLTRDNVRLTRQLARVRDDGTGGTRGAELEKELERTTRREQELQNKNRELHRRVRERDVAEADYAVGTVGTKADPVTGARSTKVGIPEKRDIPVALRSADQIPLNSVRATPIAFTKTTIDAEGASTASPGGGGGGDRGGRSGRGGGGGDDTRIGPKDLRSGLFVPRWTVPKDRLPHDAPFFFEWYNMPMNRDIDVHTGKRRAGTTLATVGSLAATARTAPGGEFPKAMNANRKIDLDSNEARRDASDPFVPTKAEPAAMVVSKFDEAPGLYRLGDGGNTEIKKPRMKKVKSCERCSTQLSSSTLGLGGNKRICHYCRRTVCANCVPGQGIAPWKVVVSGDFDPEDLCSDCLPHMHRTHALPMIPFDIIKHKAIDRFGPKHINAITLARARVADALAGPIGRRCPARFALRDVVPAMYRPLLAEDKRVSLADLVNISHGTYAAGLDKVALLFETHIAACAYCSGRGVSQSIPGRTGGR
jgi:hypothetical protein